MNTKHLILLLIFSLSVAHAANLELETTQDVADDGSVRVFQWSVPEAEMHSSPEWDGKSAMPFDLRELSAKAIQHIENRVSEPKLVHLRSVSINRGPLGPKAWYLRFHFDGKLGAVPKLLIMLPNGYILKPVDITKNQ